MTSSTRKGVYVYAILDARFLALATSALTVAISLAILICEKASHMRAIGLDSCLDAGLEKLKRNIANNRHHHRPFYQSIPW